MVNALPRPAVVSRDCDIKRVPNFARYGDGVVGRHVVGAEHQRRLPVEIAALQAALQDAHLRAVCEVAVRIAPQVVH